MPQVKRFMLFTTHKSCNCQRLWLASLRTFAQVGASASAAALAVLGGPGGHGGFGGVFGGGFGGDRGTGGGPGAKLALSAQRLGSLMHSLSRPIALVLSYDETEPFLAACHKAMGTGVLRPEHLPTVGGGSCGLFARIS